MFGSKILEVAIGIIFIYILISTICSTIREGVEAWLKTRAAYLERGIRELLHDKDAKGIVNSFYKHPLIQSLFSESYTPRDASKPRRILEKGGNLPSYIPAKNFAVALMDIAARGPDTDAVSSDPASPIISLASIRMNVLNIGNPYVQRALLTAIDSAQGDLNKAQANIEAWYDSSMDRVSGWYKRATYWVLFWIGLFVAILLNINTITIADYLYRNDAARAAIVKHAETAAADTSFQSRVRYNEAKKELDSLRLPIGWEDGWGAPRPGLKGFYFWNDFLAVLLGWLLTAVAATIGAPFWFDLLNKVMVIRSTVKPHEKSPEEASEDRQHPKPGAPAAPVPAQPPGAVAANIGVAFPQAHALQGIPTPRDTQSNIDGCDVAIEEPTSDEELPPAEGGVA